MKKANFIVSGVFAAFAIAISSPPLWDILPAITASPARHVPHPDCKPHPHFSTRSCHSDIAYAENRVILPLI